MPHPPIEDWREVLVVVAAARRGLLDGLRAPIGAAELARARGLDERAVAVTCDALRSLGYITGGERLCLTERGAALVNPGDGGDPLAGAMLTERAIRNHLALADVLAGAPAPDDVSAGDDVTRRRFLRAMNHVAAPRSARTAELVGRPQGVGELLDVGGAPGAYARAFTAAGWRVTVVDLPQTIALTAADLRAAGIAAVGADITHSLPAGPWEAIYLGNVLHLFGPVTAAAIVARAGADLAPGGVLAIQEMLPGRAPQAAAFGLMMLLGTPDGRVHAEADYAGWMVAAGCVAQAAVDVVDDQHQLILGRRV